jgi:hypothetical protein
MYTFRYRCSFTARQRHACMYGCMCDSYVVYICMYVHAVDVCEVLSSCVRCTSNVCCHRTGGEFAARSSAGEVQGASRRQRRRNPPPPLQWQGWGGGILEAAAVAGGHKHRIITKGFHEQEVIARHYWSRSVGHGGRKQCAGSRWGSRRWGSRRTCVLPLYGWHAVGCLLGQRRFLITPTTTAGTYVASRNKPAGAHFYI